MKTVKSNATQKSKQRQYVNRLINGVYPGLLFHLTLYNFNDNTMVMKISIDE